MIEKGKAHVSSLLEIEIESEKAKKGVVVPAVANKMDVKARLPNFLLLIWKPT